MRLRRKLLSALAALVVATCVVPAASADVVRLRSGEAIKGRVLKDRTSEDVLVVEDYLAGASRELSWDAVDPADRARIRTDLGFGDVGEVTIPCDLVSFRLDNGSVVVIKCVILKEEGGALIVRTLADKGMRLASNRVVARAKGECEPQELYTATEIAEKYKEELQPSDARSWFNFAQLCEAAGSFQAAKEGYENAASDEAYPKRKQAQDGATRMESILRDQEAVNEIIQLKQAVGAAQWKRVREAIDGFAAKHPTIGDAAKKKLEDLKTLFAKRRTAHFTAKVADRLEKILREDLIKKRVAPKDAAYNDVQAWIRREAVTEAFEKLVTELQKSDPAITAEEVKTFWEGREKRSWRNAKYASGTRFIYPPKVTPKTGTKQVQPQRNQGGGPAPVLKLPEPPSRDDWWKDLPIDERVAFWWAVFVEKSGLFEVDPKQVKAACAKCEGEGVKTYMLSNGMQATTLCERCAGARYDISVRYR
ncbi:MAG: hypothetical protein JNM10_03260 [Planctomycetia bacterium]|nr:hypothetical protein [Planctomycetia bacterium]